MTTTASTRGCTGGTHPILTVNLHNTCGSEITAFSCIETTTNCLCWRDYIPAGSTHTHFQCDATGRSWSAAVRGTVTTGCFTSPC